MPLSLSLSFCLCVFNCSFLSVTFCSVTTDFINFSLSITIKIFLYVFVHVNMRFTTAPVIQCPCARLQETLNTKFVLRVVSGHIFKSTELPIFTLTTSSRS
uniref:Secreted protein n=1 Tax=Trypanosoma vivax (strain Y486) TaxID=1055687 RepID=G0UBF4_TRYVY|nr:hypothetical protein TVY486_1106330 [Trypanosoma vivax Y486]